MSIQNGARAPGGGASAETLSLVRTHVRDLLQKSPAFLALPPERQREIANQTVQVASYLAEPEGIRANRLKGAAAADPYALAQAGEGGASGSPGGFQAPRFEAQGVREGAAAAGLFLQQVNFPDFVGGLINNVFQAIVTSSIQQMEAYGKLVADVSKTLNQFRDENVSVNQGRDYLAETFPDTFELDLDTGGEDGQPRVRLREGVDDRQALARVNSLPIEGGPITSLDDDVIEERLVPAARTQLASSRQQLLATIVLMGINRIVVSDGRIQAKVMFDFQARDSFRFQGSATQFDYDPTLKKETIEGEGTLKRIGETSISYGGADVTRDASYYTKGAYRFGSEPVLRMASASQIQNDAQLTAKAQLMGNVEVNFKSDYLPLEKMADSFQIARIQEASRPGQVQPAASGAAPAPAAPAPAPQPAPAA